MKWCKGQEDQFWSFINENIIKEEDGQKRFREELNIILGRAGIYDLEIINEDDNTIK